MEGDVQVTMFIWEGGMTRPTPLAILTNQAVEAVDLLLWKETDGKNPAGDTIIDLIGSQYSLYNNLGLIS